MLRPVFGPFMGVVIVSAAAAACASSPRPGASGGCELAQADSAYLSGRPLYRDCAVDTPARPVATPLEYVPATTPERGVTCYTAEVTFVVGTDGRPERESIRVVRSRGAGFVDAVVASVPTWVYTPAVREGAPVRQIVSIRRVLAVGVMVVPANQVGRMRRPPGNCR